MFNPIIILEGCNPHEFRCNDARDECIPMSKVCDLHRDCLEEEDEINCGTVFDLLIKFCLN